MVIPSDADPDADAAPDEPEPDEPGGSPRRRPVQVTVAAGFLFVIALVWLLGAITYFWASTDEQVLRDNDISSGTAVGFGIGFLVLGAVQAAAGVLVLRGSNPGRIAAVAVCALGVLVGLLGIPGLAIHLAVVYMLLGPRSSREFFVRSAPAEPAQG
jgi:hypothetical protein